MKIDYNAPKGSRIMKGTYKNHNKKFIKNRCSNFFGVSVEDGKNCWYQTESNIWSEFVNNSKESQSTHMHVRSLKSLIRYIKKHPELKGHTIVLNSSFVGHNITIYA